ncbi:phosphate-starvation-inducible PsiE family protein [Planktothrix agardhii 1033]|nr:phosphate-starvation-inducible PsiE family protein [Planktothrix agardhii 1033]
MSRKRTFFQSLTHWFSDENFLMILEEIQVAIAKTLSIAMVIIIIVCCGQLIVYLAQKLLTDSSLIFKDSLFEIFGLFLNVLIAIASL